MKIKEYNQMKEELIKDDRGDSTGAFINFVREQRALDQEPRTMAQEPRNMYNQGQLVQNTADGSRPGYGGYDNVFKNKQGNWVFRQGKGDDVIYRSGFKNAKAASAWGEKEFVKKYALPKDWITTQDLSELTGVGDVKGSGTASPFYERADRPKYLKSEAEKLLKPVKVGEGTKGQTFWKRPNKKQIEYLKKYSKAPVITERLAKNIQIILKNKSIMNDLTGVNKGGRTLPDINKVIKVFEKQGIRISDASAANALQKISYLLRGDTFQSNVDFKIDKNTGKFITKELEKLNFEERWARGIYKHALNEIRTELGDTAGNLESFKRNLRKRLPDGFLQKHGLEINEIFSVRASARNKSFPYAYFIDATDAELNKKALRSFHGALSNAQFNLNNKIKDIRAGKAKYDDAVDIVNKFEKTRNKFKNTIETNYPGKKFNLANIVLGKEKEVLKSNMKIPEDIYSKKLLNKWADQGLDITGHAKQTGYVMTGAADEGVFTAQDLSRNKKVREQLIANITALCPRGGSASGGRIGFKLGGAATLECGIAQFNKNLKTGNANSVLMRRILANGGNILKGSTQMLNPKELLRLRNLIGPTALGFIAAWEAGEITTDHLRKGIPWNEAFAKNWLTKSFLPYSEEFAKQKNLLQSGKLNESQRIYALDMMKAEKTWKEMDRIDGMERDQLVKGTMDDDFIFNSQEKIDAAKTNVNRILEDLDSRDSFRNTGKQMENIREMDEKAATELAGDDWKPIRHILPDSWLETWGIGKGFEDSFEPKVTRGDQIARAGKNAIVGHKVDYSRPTYDKAITTPLDADQLQAYAEYHRDIGELEPREELPPAYIDYLQKREKWRQLFEKNPSGLLGTQYNADGGRAGYTNGGLTRTVAPDSGPMSQGLRSLYINDKDY